MKTIKATLTVTATHAGGRSKTVRADRADQALIQRLK